jgi:hypothetical protein
MEKLQTQRRRGRGDSFRRLFGFLSAKLCVLRVSALRLLCGFLDDTDFFVRQAVEVIAEAVNFAVGNVISYNNSSNAEAQRTRRITDTLRSAWQILTVSRCFFSAKLCVLRVSALKAICKRTP